MSDHSVLIDQVLPKLVGSSQNEHGVSITLPSMYPSGAPVQIHVTQHGASCLVNDLGGAAMEAQLAGATQKLFNAQAREVADQSGIRFDNHSFFAVNVDQGRLDGAIRVVAAASQKAVHMTEAKLTEQNDAQNRSLIAEAFATHFGKSAVTMEVEFKGSSSRAWRFAGQVKTDAGNALFDAVSDHPNSVFAAHTKFFDVKKLETAPVGIIGIPSFRTFKPDLYSLLQQTANVVEIGSSREVLQKAIGSRGLS